VTASLTAKWGTFTGLPPSLKSPAVVLVAAGPTPYLPANKA
jgi:hypothetical protein